MKIINENSNINFLGQRKFAAVISCILIIAGVFSLVTKGLNLSIDFTGGSVIEVKYDQPANLDQIRQTLVDNGHSKAVVQNFGSVNDVMIRVPVNVQAETATEETVTEEAVTEEKGQEVAAEPTEQVANNAQITAKIFSYLEDAIVDNDKVALSRVEFVGPQFGKELVEKGILALIYALGFVMIYVALRFEWKFGVGSVIALVHDVLITIGVFAVIQMEFSLAVLAAVLAVIGYSLNDTIVVFDRIRENFRKVRETDTVEIMNLSVNQTLPRTILTSVTTLLVLVALFVFGGDSLKGFSVALIIGVLVGTYSSIFVASPVVLALGVSKQDLIREKVEKEGVDQVDLDLIP